MLLKEHSSGRLVEVLDVQELANPNHLQVRGRYNVGEELQEAENFGKIELDFLSGEPLPKCWLDLHYRDVELARARGGLAH